MSAGGKQGKSGRHDCVIVGGGHNGLVCAAYLAREGKRVLVLERADRVGGAAVTDEIAPGYFVSTRLLPDEPAVAGSRARSRPETAWLSDSGSQPVVVHSRCRMVAAC